MAVWDLIKSHRVHWCAGCLLSTTGSEFTSKMRDRNRGREGQRRLSWLKAETCLMHPCMHHLLCRHACSAVRSHWSVQVVLSCSSFHGEKRQNAAHVKPLYNADCIKKCKPLKHSASLWCEADEHTPRTDNVPSCVAGASAAKIVQNAKEALSMPTYAVFSLSHRIKLLHHWRHVSALIVPAAAVWVPACCWVRMDGFQGYLLTPPIFQVPRLSLKMCGGRVGFNLSHLLPRDYPPPP